VDLVDFLRRSLTVNRQLVTVRYGVTEFGPLKTARSYRTVPLADVALDALARHVQRFGTGVDGLLLHEDGRPVHASRFVKLWQQTRRRAVLQTARFHDARHTYASVLLSAGVSVPAAAEYLGDSPAVLLSTYAHLLPDDHDRAAGRLSRRRSLGELRTFED
jgi:integrase